MYNWKCGSVGLIIFPPEGSLYLSFVADGNLRLISSAGRTSSLTAGRLEIFYDDEWGTVCDDGFGMTDAIAACRQLGFEGAINFNNAGSLG